MTTLLAPADASTAPALSTRPQPPAWWRSHVRAVTACLDEAERDDNADLALLAVYLRSTKPTDSFEGRASLLLLGIENVAARLSKVGGVPNNTVGGFTIDSPHGRELIRESRQALWCLNALQAALEAAAGPIEE